MDRHTGQSFDCGPADHNVWQHYLGPSVVEFCGRPKNTPSTQRSYHINFSRGSFGNIRQSDVVTPGTPPDPSTPDYCGNSRPDH